MEYINEKMCASLWLYSRTLSDVICDHVKRDCLALHGPRQKQLTVNSDTEIAISHISRICLSCNTEALLRAEHVSGSNYVLLPKQTPLEHLGKNL